MMKYYVYAHYRNDTGEVFYVGKGEGNRYKSKQGRNPYWANIVKAHGYKAEILQRVGADPILTTCAD